MSPGTTMPSLSMSASNSNTLNAPKLLDDVKVQQLDGDGIFILWAEIHHTLDLFATESALSSPPKPDGGR